ncbi:MAG TPA: amidohydrolase family protein [Phycisphaerae bacterium]|nr:amidohydrolase family protein [Phycisphaerae bacterium]
MKSSANVYRVRWVIDATGSVIDDGAVVAAGGRIARVGPWSKVRPHVAATDAVEEFADAAILPGFVNAHTHLNLSDMAGTLRPTSNFTAWIGKLALRRHARTRAQIRRAVARGAADSLAAGTVAGADVTPEPHFDEALGDQSARWRVFGELLRFGDAGLKNVDETIAALDALQQKTGAAVGLAPHAPYTVGVEVFIRARREADARGWPVAAHLHETLDEIAFTERGEGSLHEWLSRLRFLPRDLKPSGLRPIPMLAEAGFFSGPVLVAHGNYLTDAEVGILAESGSSVAYCPHSHAFFQHAAHPWRRLLAAGVNVCLGTDSLASSPSLSILAEARFLAAREPDADPKALLAMATRRGARALGLEKTTGDLRKGLAAEFCVVGPLPDTDDPLRAIMAGEGNLLRVVGV